MFWAVGTGIATRGIGLFTTLLLTAYMSPQQAGSVNVAFTLVSTVSVLTTVGVGQYVASQRQPLPRVAYNAFLLHTGLGVLGLLAVLLFRRQAAEAFDAVSGVAFIPALALSILLERIQYVPERVLAAHMRFRQLSIIRSLSELLYCAGAIVGALCGLGPWAIVLGNLCRQMRFAVTLRYTPPAEWLVRERPDRALLRVLVRFGLPIMVALIAGFATRRWDNLMVAHFYGTAAVGLYNLSYNLAEIPAVQIAEVTGDVLAPALARLEAADRRQTAVRMAEALALMVFPLAIGLALVAPTVSRLLPGRWAGITPYLIGLSTLSLSRPVSVLMGVYLLALRRTIPSAVLQGVQVVLLLGTLLLCGALFPAQPAAACWAVSLAFLVGSALAVAVLSRVDQVSSWQLVRAHLLPVPALIFMALAVKGLDLGLSRLALHLPPLAHLALQVICGGAAYLAGVAATLPSEVQRLRGLLAELRAARSR
jgi:PST family polysaccharide transporter